MQIYKKNKLNKIAIGFIGVGLMGEGMVCKLIYSGFKVYVKKNKNPEPINRVKLKGAIEVKTLKNMTKKCEIFILCLPNSKVVKQIISKLDFSNSKRKLIIDCTTNNHNSVLDFKKLSKTNNFNYVEAPISGGNLQAKNGELGAFIGSSKTNFKISKKILNPCCKKIIRIGNVGMGAKAKLLSNFLALGTASLVIESLKFAKKLKIDWKKFYDLSSLGSGSSKSLDRIAPQAIKNNYDSYFFTINNTIKDFKYMLKLFDGNKDMIKIIKSFLKPYIKEQKKLEHNALISHRLKINSY